MTSATPNIPEAVSSTPGTWDTRVADPDIILFDNLSLPVEVMTDLIFENIGGQEIINVSRNDLVNGQSVIYRPIKNLEDIYTKYNPNNIVSLQQTAEDTFRNFSIKFARYIPEVGTGPSGNFVYIDSQSGSVVVEVIGIGPGEQVEVEIVNSTVTFDDTIYIEGIS